eukprot:scaffold79065_cov63-Phaeocystis_antarctica.AAC.2
MAGRDDRGRVTHVKRESLGASAGSCEAVSACELVGRLRHATEDEDVPQPQTDERCYDLAEQLVRQRQEVRAP